MARQDLALFFIFIFIKSCGIIKQNFYSKASCLDQVILGYILYVILTYIEITVGGSLGMSKEEEAKRTLRANMWRAVLFRSLGSSTGKERRDTMSHHRKPRGRKWSARGTEPQQCS